MEFSGIREAATLFRLLKIMNNEGSSSSQASPAPVAAPGGTQPAANSTATTKAAAK